MSFFRKIYNAVKPPDYEHVWRQFSAENNGNYIVGQYDDHDSVEIIYRNHKIIFDRINDNPTILIRSSPAAFTRIRLEFKSPDNLKFRIVEQTIVDDIGKLFGQQDIKTGNKEFDFRFLISSNDEYKLQALFQNKEFLSILQNTKDVHLEILEESGIFGENISPDKVMLYFISNTKIKKIEQLNTLFKLYQIIIDELTKVSSMNKVFI
jgi:hypothetical protein